MQIGEGTREGTQLQLLKSFLHSLANLNIYVRAKDSFEKIHKKAWSLQFHVVKQLSTFATPPLHRATFELGSNVQPAPKFSLLKYSISASQRTIKLPSKNGKKLPLNSMLGTITFSQILVSVFWSSNRCL